MKEIIRTLETRLEENLDHYFSLAKELHDYKEISFQEHRSVTLHKEETERAGFVFDGGYKDDKTLKTAFVAAYDRKELKRFHTEKRGEEKTRRRIALISEYDALEKIGHGCGHNLIAVSSMAAFLLLGEVRGHFKHDLVLLGTPAEEFGGGKQLLLDAGFFQSVDAAVMLHPSDKNRMVSGMLNIRNIRFAFHGKSSHAAFTPHRGINALDAVLQLFNGVNAARQQLPPTALVHGVITEGGKAPNIIPDYTEAHFYVRALDDDEFSHTLEMVRKCAEGAALQSGCKLESRNDAPDYLSFVPNRTLAGMYRDALKKIGMEENQIGENEQIASSDIGNLSHEIPTFHGELCLKQGSISHNREFAEATVSPLGREYLKKAILLHLHVLVKLLTSDHLINDAINEFNSIKKKKEP